MSPYFKPDGSNLSLSVSYMTITDLVAPEAIIPALKVNSKKQALQ
jgi:hypothetical protein